MDVHTLNTPLKVGLTGGIGSGKTTVADLFARLSVPIIEADEISREVVKTGEPAYEKIIKLFGNDIINEDGELRRDYLRKLIFNDMELKKQLESIIHPDVRKRINDCIKRVTHPYCIISIPLLFESGLQNTVDRILVIDTSEALQISRASKRDHVEPDDIRKIIQNQISRNDRLVQADDVIVNNEDIEQLVSQVEKLNSKYLKLAKELSG